MAAAIRARCRWARWWRRSARWSSAAIAEIVLTGVDLTSYGADLPGTPKLGQLAKQILRHVPELKRLRISSVDSIEVDRDLLDVIADDERLMPHLHLSLQSGDDLILKRMKRRHSRSEAIDFCAQVRRLRPDIALGADIIAGFPTETEEMFARSQDLVEECDLTFLHVFPYSPRPGTPAARMPQVRGSNQGTRQALAGDGRGRLATAAGFGNRRDAPGSDRKRHAGPHRTFHAGGYQRRDAGRGADAEDGEGMTGRALISDGLIARLDAIHSPFQPQARSRSCTCAGAGATTCTGSLFFEIGIPISRECRCSLGSPKRGPFP